MTLLRDLVAASSETTNTSARNAKVSTIAQFLSMLEPDEIATAIALLSGEPKQGRVGVGWATVASAVAELSTQSRESETRPLELEDVDTAIVQIAGTHGDGSATERRSILEGLFGRATPDEDAFLRAILTGGLRQGAGAGVVASAVAKAFNVKLGSVRRAAMLLGDLGEAAEIAAATGEGGLAGVGLQVGRAVQPMLASTANSVGDALDHTGAASVEWKLDGIRIQVHKTESDVRVYTRNLNDITERTPRVVDVVRKFGASTMVLDGEILGSEPHFFDILHLNGDDLLEATLAHRSAVLDSVAPEHRIPSVVTNSNEVAAGHLERAIAAGHEGVMVKGLDTTYEAGRRGKGWRKVKPVHTLDLVVLGAEWGHGRRTGWLSNLHLGARDSETGEFVMVGKTFKGLTDEMLEWQTAQFLEREISREGITVFVRPEMVVEIALDASHTSTRYPGGVALRFARVRRYRDDKSPEEADTLDAVRALMTQLPASETR